MESLQHRSGASATARRPEAVTHQWRLDRSCPEVVEEEELGRCVTL